MPFPHLLRRSLLAALPLLLVACGGGSDDKADPSLRVLNLSEVSALDLFIDDERKVSAAGTWQITSTQTLSEETYDLELRRAGTDLALATGERNFLGDENYTLIAWGRESNLNFLTVSENQDLDELDANQTGLRVLNASLDAGDLDVYLTTTNADLGDSVPTQRSVGSGRLSGTQELSSGTYRLRVTGAGDSTDLRLDIPQIRLSAKTYLTLILTSGSGGVLVHAASLQEQGAFNALRNTKARVRVAAGVPGRGVVQARWQGGVIGGSLGSPSVGSYQLVDAGAGTLDVFVGGQRVSATGPSLEAGADYTLLVHGSGQPQLISDDNRLPSNLSRARIRLVHGAPLAEPMTLALDYAVAVADVMPGSASSFVSVVSGETRRVEVTVPSLADSVYLVEEARVQAGSSYTVFLLGGSAAPSGLMRKDR